MVKQPRGGYVNPSQFEKIEFDDGITPNENENIHPAVVGLVVDYMTRFCLDNDITKAFEISLRGAISAENFGNRDSVETAISFLERIKGIDDESIIFACKLATFDVWYRNAFAAMRSKTYKETYPDTPTIQNIQTFVKRGISFFEKYGPITKDGFDFRSPESDKKGLFKKIKELIFGRDFGGYTETVDAGDGDFLTSDTLWDFKVSKNKPNGKNTLQLLMYWIMGQHSGQDIFKNITKIGFFNPRLNVAYLLDIKDVSNDIIRIVEDDIICY